MYLELQEKNKKEREKMLRKEDKFLEGQILDKLRQCEEMNMFCCTTFLDLHQQSFAQQILNRELKKTKVIAVFHGGYEEAIRRVLFFFPEYWKDTWREMLEEVFAVVEVKQGKDPYSLNHRDYLGAFLGLGIKRERMGDILVKERRADILLFREIMPIVLENYSSVGRSSVSVSEKKLGEITIEEEVREQKRGTVASNRLDNFLTLCFSTGRNQSQEWIQQGIVFVNYQEMKKNEFPLKNEDILVVRGQGKVRIEEIGDLTKKGKLTIYYTKY